MLVEETNAGDTARPECPCDDQEKQSLCLRATLGRHALGGGGRCRYCRAAPSN